MNNPSPLLSNDAVHHRIATWIKQEVEKREDFKVNIVTGSTDAKVFCYRQLAAFKEKGNEKHYWFVMLEYTGDSTIKLHTWRKASFDTWDNETNLVLPRITTYEVWCLDSIYDIADPKSLDKILEIALKEINRVKLEIEWE